MQILSFIRSLLTNLEVAKTFSIVFIILLILSRDFNLVLKSLSKILICYIILNNYFIPCLMFFLK